MGIAGARHACPIAGAGAQFKLLIGSEKNFRLVTLAVCSAMAKA